MSEVDSVDARDEALTRDILARFVAQKELELEESEGVVDSVRIEYERSLSYRIGMVPLPEFSIIIRCTMASDAWSSASRA